MLGLTDKTEKQIVKNMMALKKMCLQDVKERDNKKLRLDLHNHLPSTVQWMTHMPDQWCSVELTTVCIHLPATPMLRYQSV